MKHFLYLFLTAVSLNSFSQQVEIIKVNNYTKQHIEYTDSFSYTLMNDKVEVASVIVDLRTRTCLISLEWDGDTRHFDLNNEDKCLQFYDNIFNFIGNYGPFDNSTMEIRYLKDQPHSKALLLNLQFIQNDVVTIIEVNVTGI